MVEFSNSPPSILDSFLISSSLLKASYCYYVFSELYRYCFFYYLLFPVFKPRSAFPSIFLLIGEIKVFDLFEAFSSFLFSVFSNPSSDFTAFLSELKWEFLFH
jgi:hypothetical protein